MSLADLAHLTPAQQRELAWFSDAQGGNDPKQLPGKPQVWKVGGRFFVVYYLPGTTVPIAWEATETELRDKFGGVDAPMPALDREMSEEQFSNIAPWHAGRISELRNTSDDPWSQFYADYRKSADLRPWLNDPDMLSTIVVAFLEGREPTADELAQTNWWKTHTEAERQWLETSVTLGDDEIARRRSDSRRQVAATLRAAGSNNAPESVVNFIADKVLTGAWSQEYAAEQMNLVVDPFAPGTLNWGIQRLLGEQHDQTRQEEDTVRNLVTTWLGPQMGQWSDTEVARWAGRLRNDPDAAIELQELLRNQRLALFPKYENPNLTYEDIVSPFRNMATNIWGQPIQDETMLVDLANIGDYTEAQKRLRHTGLQRGVQKVVHDALADLSSTSVGERVVQSTL